MGVLFPALERHGALAAAIIAGLFLATERSVLWAVQVHASENIAWQALVGVGRGYGPQLMTMMTGIIALGVLAMWRKGG
jgi:hypothetical protein